MELVETFRLPTFVAGRMARYEVVAVQEGTRWSCYVGLPDGAGELDAARSAFADDQAALAWADRVVRQTQQERLAQLIREAAERLWPESEPLIERAVGGGHERI